MSENGVRTTGLGRVPLLDEVLGNREGSSVRQSFSDLSTQLAGTGGVADALSRLQLQIASSGLIVATWSGLVALAGSEDGAGAEVVDSDTGTHLQATGAGYDGAAVDNAGRYSWNATWSRWVRVGDTLVGSLGSAAAADVGDFATPEDLAGKADAVATAEALAGKADATATTEALAGKADATATTEALAGKADATATTEALAGKADATATTEALAGKADATATTEALAGKADATATTEALAGKADATATTEALAGKADATATTEALAGKADATATTEALAGKADATATTEALAFKANASETNDRIAAGDKALGTRIDAISIPDLSRPGEAPDYFSSVLTGEPVDRPVLDNGYVVINADGAKIWAMPAPASIAPRRAFEIDPTAIYRLDVVLKPLADSTDPSGDAVQVIWQSLDRNKAALPPIVVKTWDNPLVADPDLVDGFLKLSVTISRDVSKGAMFTVSALTRYGVPTVESQGVTATMGVVSIRLTDITALHLVDTSTADALALKADLIGGKVPIEQLPDDVLGALKYQGVWNADTNTPPMPAAAEGNVGFYFVVDTAGTTEIDGVDEWARGDWIVSNGTVWSKIDGSDAVVSVNGEYGAVIITKAKIGLGDVENIAPAAMPISSLQQARFDAEGESRTAQDVVLQGQLDPYIPFETTRQIEGRMVLDDEGRQVQYLPYSHKYPIEQTGDFETNSALFEHVQLDVEGRVVFAAKSPETQAAESEQLAALEARYAPFETTRALDGRVLLDRHGREVQFQPFGFKFPVEQTGDFETTSGLFGYMQLDVEGRVVFAAKSPEAQATESEQLAALDARYAPFETTRALDGRVLLDRHGREVQFQPFGFKFPVEQTGDFETTSALFEHMQLDVEGRVVFAAKSPETQAAETAHLAEMQAKFAPFETTRALDGTMVLDRFGREVKFVPFGFDYVADLQGKLERGGLIDAPTYGAWALRDVRQRLRQILRGEAVQMVLAIVGDSYTQKWDRYVGPLTEALWEQYGFAGVGYTSFGWFGPQAPIFYNGGTQPVGSDSGTTHGNPWAQTTYSGAWVRNYNWPSTGMPSISSVKSSTATNYLKIAVTKAGHDAARLFYTGDGTAVIAVSWDDGATYGANVNLSTVGPSSVDLVGIPATTFTMRIKVVSGTVELGGIDFRSSVAGVRIHRLGGSGSTAAQWANAGAPWAAQINTLAPHGLIIAHGTNDQTAGSTAAEMRGFVEAIATEVLSQRTVDVMLTTPPENNRTNNPIAMPEYALAHRASAYANGWAHLDYQLYFGPADNFGAAYANANPERPWFSSDLVHPEPGFGIMDDALARFITAA